MENIQRFLGQSVKITQNGITGIIRALYIDQTKEIQFLVSYTDMNCAIFERYFKAHELQGLELIK